jgi:DNA-binding response OmpR family regulator/anti-sigma regulatory factor (Ser/Thr protein kinase)
MMKDTILAADDDRGTLLLIQSILGDGDYRLVTADDGAAARSLIEAEPARFSAVLLDWEMPGMAGIDLLRWIKQRPDLADVPVILQTARDSVEHIREGIDAGAFYYLTKPFDRRLLLSIVNAALGDFHKKSALIRQLRESQNPFQSLEEGTFRFRTLKEGEQLAVWIAHACPEPERAMAIMEIMANAVEHGNLGITYGEKTALLDQGRWMAEVERRLGLPEFAGKYVEVRVKKTSEKLTALVEDQGAGFAFEKYLRFNPGRAFDNHGRGIAMAGMSMSMEYLGRGNRVRVTVPFGPS